VQSAARLGLPTLSSFFVSIDELRRRHAVYREVAREAGRSESEIEALEQRAWGMRVVHVAPSRAEALAAVEGPFMGYQRKMAILRSDSTGGTVPNSFDRTLLKLRPFADYLATDWMLLGTADEVREGLERYLEATGYRRLLLLMAVPGLATELALRSMRLFAEHVAPALTSVADRA
jgi:alkanesulfonate monooxygenase SsuD/methylene tetrahydromethanopterin reductase-like flavin-dependent oxidoreductase (luciferase family)